MLHGKDYTGWCFEEAFRNISTIPTFDNKCRQSLQCEAHQVVFSYMDYWNVHSLPTPARWLQIAVCNFQTFVPGMHKDYTDVLKIQEHFNNHHIWQQMQTKFAVWGTLRCCDIVIIEMCTVCPCQLEECKLQCAICKHLHVIDTHLSWVHLSAVHKGPQKGKCALTPSDIAQALTTGGN